MIEKYIDLVEILILFHCIFYVAIFASSIRKNKAVKFLSLFLLASGLMSVSYLCSFLGISCPELASVTSLKWLPMPLLYLYTQHISILRVTPKKYLLLLAPAIELIVLVTYNLMDPADSGFLRAFIDSSFIFYSMILYNIIVLYLTCQTIKAHNEKIEGQYSNTQGINLNWIHTLIYISTPLLVFVAILEFTSMNIYFSFGLSLAKLIIIYWFTYRSHSQYFVKNLFNDVESTASYKSIRTDTQRVSLLMIEIEEAIVKNELYLKPDLNINHLAEYVGEHPKLISKAINNLKEQNFNSYINKFRVDRVKTLLNNHQISNFNIEGIGKLAGFKSNSSFYRAFNKETGLTPLAYYKELKDKSS